MSVCSSTAEKITLTYRSIVFIATVVMTALAVNGFYRLSRAKRRRRLSTAARRARALLPMDTLRNGVQNMQNNNHIVAVTNDDVTITNSPTLDSVTATCMIGNRISSGNLAVVSWHMLFFLKEAK